MQVTITTGTVFPIPLHYEFDKTAWQVVRKARVEGQ